MPKKITESQDQGNAGEQAFADWAAKMHWYPTKLVPDAGIDYVCQIRGERISASTSVMPGHLLNVSVRSTVEDSDSVKIDRSDAELIFSTASPMVFALVRRAPLGQADQIAIRVCDEAFVAEIEHFLRSTKNTHTLHFSDAMTNPCEIQENVEQLFIQPHRPMIARIRAEFRLNGLLQGPHAEILHTELGTVMYIHSEDLESQTIVSQNVDLESAIQDIGINVVFTPRSLIPPHGMRETGPSAGGRVAMPEERVDQPHAMESTGEELTGFPRIRAQIEKELSLWNYDLALTSAEQLESEMQKGQIGTDAVPPEILFLLARVHVIHGETEDAESAYHITQANEFLTRIDKFLSTTPSSELSEDVGALRGAIENIENGPDAALAFLADYTNPYAVRIRLAMFVNKQELDNALSLIEGRSLHLSWCDLGTTVFAAKGRVEDAMAVVKWAKEHDQSGKYPQCVVRLADALMGIALADQEPGRNILPYYLSDEERIKVREVIEVL